MMLPYTRHVHPDHPWTDERGVPESHTLREALLALFIRKEGRWARQNLCYPAELAPGWHLAYRVPDYDAAVYAVAPLHFALRLFRVLAEWRWPFYLLGFIEPTDREFAYYGPGAPWRLNPLAVHRRRLAHYRRRIPGLTWKMYARAWFARWEY